jgi:hypothetical protein
MASDKHLIHGLMCRVYTTLGRDNNVIESPDEMCVEAAGRIIKLRAVRDAAQQLMDYFERSLGAGPLTNNPGKEGALINLLRTALAEATTSDR